MSKTSMLTNLKLTIDNFFYDKVRIQNPLLSSIQNTMPQLSHWIELFFVEQSRMYPEINIKLRERLNCLQNQAKQLLTNFKLMNDKQFEAKYNIIVNERQQILKASKMNLVQQNIFPFSDFDIQNEVKKKDKQIIYLNTVIEKSIFQRTILKQEQFKLNDMIKSLNEDLNNSKEQNNKILQQLTFYQKQCKNQKEEKNKFKQNLLNLMQKVKSQTSEEIKKVVFEFQSLKKIHENNLIDKQKQHALKFVQLSMQCLTLSQKGILLENQKQQQIKKIKSLKEQIGRLNLIITQKQSKISQLVFQRDIIYTRASKLNILTQLISQDEVIEDTIKDFVEQRTLDKQQSSEQAEQIIQEQTQLKSKTE